MRKKGRSLSETGYSLSKVVIYRAAVAPTTTFNYMDYITRSRKFAIDHAKHVAVVEEEPANVLKATVNASDVYEAYNPGEYFYAGPTIEGSIITVVPAFDPNNPNQRRRNPDERLRDLERQYAASPDEDLKVSINALRLRIDLPLLPPSCKIYSSQELHTASGEPVQVWTIQSDHIGGRVISSHARQHNGWWGVSHVWFPGESDAITEIGEHRLSEPPTLLQVLEAHLHVTYQCDISPHDEIRVAGLGERHQCTYNYELTTAPSCYRIENNQLVRTYSFRELLGCQHCEQLAVGSCAEHDTQYCESHATPCEEPDCDNTAECPQCAPICGVCNKPACGDCVREAECGRYVCTRPDSDCWNHCEDCGVRLCKVHTVIHDPGQQYETWYCRACNDMLDSWE